MQQSIRRASQCAPSGTTGSPLRSPRDLGPRTRHDANGGIAALRRSAGVFLLLLLSACAVEPGSRSSRRYEVPSTIPATLADVTRPPRGSAHAEVAALNVAARRSEGARLRRAFLLSETGQHDAAISELNLVIHGVTPPTANVEAIARALRAIAFRRLDRRNEALHDEQIARGLSNDPDLLALLAPIPQAVPSERSGLAPRLAELRIEDRSAWNARPVRRNRVDPMGAVHRITVHHSATAIRGTSRSRTIASIRAIQLEHRKRGYGDVGYHFFIDPSGRIWEGRPARYMGAHVKAANSHNLGICMLGDLRPRRSGAPTRAQTDSLERLVLALMAEHQIAPSELYTHGEVRRSTECPGPFLARHVDEFRARLRSGLAISE